MKATPDKEAFFRSAILNITGSLQIEEALYRCYLFFKDFLPLDHLMFMHPEYETNRMKVLAVANDDGGVIDRRHWNVPRELIEKMRRNQLPAIMIANEPETHFVAKHALSLGAENRSVMVVRLFIKETLIGSLIFSAEGHHQYNDQHSELLAPLREPFAVVLSNSLQHRELIKLKESLMDDNRYLQEELRKTIGEELIGADYGLKGVMDLVRQVSPQDSSVLLIGDTGTGKELIAGAIHSHSKRCRGPLVKVNCGAISPTLIDSELFGHEKGSFTGAAAIRKGRFERASRGTLFLDEIGELTLDAQTRLLRVLQEKEIERVGGDRPLKVDVRVIAATHRNLEEMVNTGTFRKDLFFRLMVFPIEIPSLAQRKGDIPALAQHFMQKKARLMNLRLNPVLSRRGLQTLMEYNWPGNVRELENAIERELILCKGGPLNFNQLSITQIHSDTEYSSQNRTEALYLDNVIKKHIVRVLTKTDGKIGGKGGAAEILGVNPSTLRSRMRKLKLRG